MRRFAGCTLALIAGGRARRLGGISKPHLRFADGRTILVRTLELVAPLVDDVLVVTDEPHRFRGLRTIPDSHRARGVPGGLHAACANAKTPWVLALGGDLPFVDPDVLDELWRARDDADAVAFSRAGRLEPLHALYRAERCATQFERALIDSNPSARDLLELVTTRAIEVTTAAQGRSLENANTPADVARLGLRLPLAENDPTSAVRPVRRMAQARWTDESDDRVAVEEPLEIRIDGEPLATTMRTPGDDRSLVLGYLFAEGLISSLDDVGSISHCGRPGTESARNVVDVRSAPGRIMAIERVLEVRRWTTTTSSCGVCGRESIDGLLARCPRLTDTRSVPASLITDCAARLAELQPAFTRTGGMHAATAFGERGQVIASGEDVGRHNAVDKTIGQLLTRHEMADAMLLVVSGRASFEIIQKAAMARIPVVASISAPSTLAIDLAAAAGVTLASFVRGEKMNVYSHAHRLATRATERARAVHPDASATADLA